MQQHLNESVFKVKERKLKGKKMTLKNTSTKLLDQYYFFRHTIGIEHSCRKPLHVMWCTHVEMALGHSDKSDLDERCMGLRSKISQLIGLTAVHIVSIHPLLPLLLLANSNDHTLFSEGHSEYSETNSESLCTFFLLFEETYAVTLV